MATIKINNVTALTESGGVVTLDSAVAGGGAAGITSTASGTAITIDSSNNTTVVGDLIPSTPLSHRNMIINGGMQINQRGDAGQTTTTGFKGPDRFGTYNSGFTGSDPQMIYSSPDLGTTGPDGIGKSFKLAFDPSYNVTSVGANDNLYMRQIIEAQNLQHLQYGNASAKALTLSFYVRTNMNTGGANTFSVSARTPDGSDRNIGSTYTATDSNWNRYTWTIPGDTSGQIDNNNDRGMIIQWKIVSGSDFTSVANTSWASHANNRDSTGHTANILGVDGQYWEITGVQLELGSNATPFEHRTFQDDYLACQRYYYVIASHRQYIAGRTSNTDAMYCAPSCPVRMRSTPSIGNLGSFAIDCIHSEGGATSLNSTPTIDTYPTDGMGVGNSVGNIGLFGGSGLTDGRVCCARINGGLTFDAEL